MRRIQPLLLSYMTILFVIVISFSCVSEPKRKLKFALNQAGTNRKELEKVLQHYSENEKDSLKYRAATFLIENMPYYTSYTGTEIFDCAFETGLTTLERLRRSTRLKDNFNDKIDSIRLSIDEEKIIVNQIDAQIITYNQLTKHIEQAFSSLKAISTLQHISFADFCEYVLPYRANNEPLQFGTRNDFSQDFKWVLDSLKTGSCFRQVIQNVIRSHKLIRTQDIEKVYPWKFSYTQVRDLGLFKTCDEAVVYFVNLFRSLGIPASMEYVIQWGNHHSTGHSWFALYYKNYWYAFDINTGNDLKELYRTEAAPKIYRKTFSKQIHEDRNYSNWIKNDIDVTHEYKPTTQISVKVTTKAPKHLNTAGVYIFNKNKIWRECGLCSFQKDSAILNDFGNHNFYVVGYKKNNSLIPLTNAFHLNGRNQIVELEGNGEVLDSIQFSRKYPLYSARHKLKKTIWMNQIRDNKVIANGANGQAHTYRILNGNSFNIQHVDIDNRTKYSSIEIERTDLPIHLAEFRAIDINNKIVQGEAYAINTKGALMTNLDLTKIQDGNPLSFVILKRSVDFVEVKFAIPTFLDRIEYQTRNDGNNIEIGDAYELMIWDDEWTSLGRQSAKDTLITYYNVPQNRLYWLKNLTKGMEEYPFIINKKGQQVWPGMND